jgi:chromosome segregation ATPase
MNEDNQKERELDDLEGKLKELQSQLSKTDAIDPQLEQQLRAVHAHIDNILDPNQVSDMDALRDRLGEAVADFQDDHPQLAVALRDIVTALSNMGI